MLTKFVLPVALTLYPSFYFLPVQCQNNPTSKRPLNSSSASNQTNANLHNTKGVHPASVVQSPEVLLLRARQFIKVGQPKIAIQLLSKYVRIKPNDPAGHFYLGLAFDETNLPTQAIWSFSKSLEISNRNGMDSLELRVNIANTLIKLGRLDDAIFNYRRALEISPKCAQAHLNLGRALITKQSPQEAFEELNLAADFGSNEPSLFFYRALALKALHREGDAQRQLDLFLRGLPEKNGATSLKQTANELFENMSLEPTIARPK